jgi:hypothetical protein
VRSIVATLAHDGPDGDDVAHRCPWRAAGVDVTVAFAVGFAVFVVLIVALTVIAVRWAVTRDAAARARRSAPNATHGSTP